MKKVNVGVNDLATLYPDLALQWHPTKNGDLKPDDVTPGSGKDVWWLGTCGHEWKTLVKNRTKGVGCPICAGKVPIQGETDFATVFPEVAMEWNYNKNEGITPQMMSPHSGKKVWWKCKKGHEWQASIDNRVKGRGCPFCGNKAILQGYNDLNTVFPSIAKEWHPTKNGELSPQEILSGSSKKVWWKCQKCEHEWQATVSSRTHGHGCPVCGIKKNVEARKHKRQQKD